MSVTFQTTTLATPPSGTVVDTGSGAAGSGTQRVILSSDQAALPVTDNGGTLSVDDGGGSLTVDGTVSITANSSVNVAQLAGTTTDTNSGNKSAGTLRVVIATDQPALTNKLLVTPDANSAVNCAQMNGVAVTMGNGTSGTGVQRVTIASDSTGQVAITGTVTVGSHAVTNAGTFLVQNNAATPTGTNSIGTVALDNNGVGYTIASANSAASTNATSTKGSAGRVHGWSIFNSNASPRYFKLFNKASAPTVGSDTPVHRIMIPAGGGVNLDLPRGLPFSTGIAWCLTTGAADSDTGAVASNEIQVNLYYI